MKTKVKKKSHLRKTVQRIAWLQVKKKSQINENNRAA
jgi:hypothetical protein